MKRPVKLQHNWKWVQKYRVWEANRKIFLNPENWLEPDLRKEKPRFFKELEDELLQSDLKKTSPVVLAEVIALVLIGMRRHKPEDFENVVNRIMCLESEDEYERMTGISIREHLKDGIRRVLKESIN